MEKEQALQLWNKIFGNKDKAYDYASRLICKEDFEIEDKETSWTVSHKQPFYLGGSNNDKNQLISAVSTYKERDNKTTFKIDDHTYEIRKGKSFGSFSVFDVTDRNNPICMEPNEENQTEEYNLSRINKPEEIEDTEIKSINEIKEELNNDSALLVEENEKVEDENVEEKQETEEETTVDEIIEEPVAEETETEVGKIQELDETEIEQNEEDLETETEIIDENSETESEENIDLAETSEELEEVSKNTNEEINEEETENNLDESETILGENVDSTETEEKNEVQEIEEPQEEIVQEQEPIVEEVEDENEVVEEQQESTEEEQPLEEEVVEEEPVTENPTEEEIVDEESVEESLEEKTEENIDSSETDLEQNWENSETNSEQIEDNNEIEVEQLEDKVETDLGNIQEENETEKEQNQEETENEEVVEEEIVQEDQEEQEPEEELHPVEENFEKKVDESDVVEQIIDNSIQSQESYTAPNTENLDKEEAHIESRVDRINQVIEQLDQEQLQSDLVEETTAIESKSNDVDEVIKNREENKEVDFTVDEREKLEQVFRLNRVIVQKDNEIFELNEKIIHLNDVIGYLTERNKALKEEIDRLDSEKKEEVPSDNNSLIIEEIKKNNEYLIQQIEDIKKSFSSLSTARVLPEAIENIDSELVESLRTENEELKEKVKNLNNQIEYSYLGDEEISQLNIQINELNANNLNILKELDEAKRQNVIFSQRIEELETENTDLTESNDFLRQQNFDLTVDYNVACNDLDKAKNDNYNLNNLNNLLNAADIQKSETIANLAEKVKNDSDKIDLLMSEKSNSSENEFNKKLNELTTTISTLESTRNQLELENADKKKQIEELITSKESLENVVSQNQRQIEDLSGQLERNNRKIENLKNENDLLLDINSLLMLGGDSNKYDEIREYLANNGLSYTQENLKDALLSHTEWMRKDDSLIHTDEKAVEENVDTIEDEKPVIEEIDREDITELDIENKDKIRALEIFETVFGDKEISQATDFAGRDIKKEEYNTVSKFGWNILYLNEDDEINADNVIIANLKTLQDVSFNQPFNTNGHSFIIREEDGRNILTSTEFITDPYNFRQAFEVSKNNYSTNEPLIYIFVKLVGINSSRPEPENKKTFFDLISRTVRRVCPKSFLEISIADNKDYLFMTFDGKVDGSYSEAYKYSILLNSYRKEFKKLGLIDAIIVLDQVEAPSSLRHVTFDVLLDNTKDIDLHAIKYDLLTTAVVNSMIKKVMHIGPNIIDKYKDKIHENLSESYLGQGNFAETYRFTSKYYECNYVFRINKD